MLPTMFTESVVENSQTEIERLRAELVIREQMLARAEENLARAKAESAALYMTSLDISSQLDLQSTLNSILRRAHDLTGATSGLVSLVDLYTGELVISAEMGFVPGLIGARLLPGEGLSGAALLEGNPVTVENYNEWPNRSGTITEFVRYAGVAMPLRWQGNIIGVLTLYHNQPDQNFSMDDLDSLQTVAVQAAIAIYNAQRYTEERQRNFQLNTLFNAVTYVAGSLDLNEVLRAAVESFVSALNVPQCIIYENRGMAGLKMLRSNLQTSALAPETPFPASLTALLNAGRWIVLQRSASNVEADVAAYMDCYGAQSTLLMPIIIGNRSFGLVALSETAQGRQFAHEDIETAQALSAHIGVAIRHAQLHSQLQSQRVNEQATLLKLTRRLLELQQEQEVIQASVEATCEAFDTPYVLLVLAEGDSLQLGEVRGWETLARREWHKGDGTPIGYAASLGEPVTVEDVLFEARFWDASLLRDEHLRSCLIAPMIYGEIVLGAMMVCRRQPRAFSADDVRLFSLLAYQTAVALDRAQLFEYVRAHNVTLEALVKRRTSEILEQKERTEAILAATGEALIVCDKDGVIEQVNRAFETQHGYEAEAVRGQPSESIVGFNLARRADFSTSLQPWRGDLQIARRDGNVYDAATTLSPVLNSSNEVLGIVASLRDISYLKDLDRLKDMFVSNVSHELRTPLANMKLYLHLLTNGLPERRQQYNATLQREVERLQYLIEDLLSLSRLDTQGTKLLVTDAELNDLVGTLAEDRTPLANNRGLTLDIDLHPELLWVQADARMLIQAVSNLLANAMNYTPPEGRITVRTRPDLEQNEAVISVSDTGLGMTPEDQSHLFDRFFRGSAARTMNAAGTGLGMPIVHEIMKRHGGSITFESVKGRGSTFYLRLPLAAQAADTHG